MWIPFQVAEKTCLAKPSHKTLSEGKTPGEKQTKQSYRFHREGPKSKKVVNFWYS